MLIKQNDKVFKDMFAQTDLILISDTTGKILYYEDYNDEINQLRYEDAIGRSVFELYPFFRREDFTLFKCMDTQKIIVNQLQQFEVNGVPHKVLNSAYPLINENGVLGAMVMSVELQNRSGSKKKQLMQAKYNFSDIITQNAVFRSSFKKLRRLSNGNANILIYGETGTGKELIAHTIHANSPRRRKPFIIQNCAAIPPNLVESILYGTAKGSYTGSIDKPGLFEVAEGGTLFLDEVNSIPLNLQGKLLRALENHAIRRVGETFERETDVRIIASTNEMLYKMLERGEFRRDLLYRLNVASFTIPPLRDRADDIPLLCNHYITQFNNRLNLSITGIDDETMLFFSKYPWAGNVRELRNVIEYACSIKRIGMITQRDIPDYMHLDSNYKDSSMCIVEASSLSVGTSSISENESYVQAGKSLSTQMNRLEKDIISKSFERNRYNITKTADELKISRQTLYNKLKKYDLL